MDSITAALEAITGPAPQGGPVAAARLHVQRRKDLLKARDRRRAILNPANADEIVAAFPEPGEELHALIPGTFAFGDLIQRVVRRHGAPNRMDVSTLSLSEDNGDRVWIVAGSANLRSSNCIEQLTVFADPDLFAFYRGGFDWLIEECQVADRRPTQPPLVPLT